MTRLWILALFVTIGSSVWGTTRSVPASQKDYELEINSVVRNKLFYKKGHIEVSLGGGILPLDSLIDHTMAGGRLTWHISDHFGWEIIDAQFFFPTVNGFTTDLVNSKGISNLQTAQLKMALASSLLVSPLYGKIRAWGETIIHFDLYLSLGFGTASTEVLKFSSPGANQGLTQSTLKSGSDLMAVVGMGFKFFMGSVLGLNLDLRNYLVNSEVYAQKSFKSNFAVSLGLVFFLPSFSY